MKNKKGFTLSEILIVIAIIGVIILIAVPSILNVSNKIKTREYDTKINSIKTAAETYAQNNSSLFGKDEYKIDVPIGTLLYNGYLASDVSDNKPNCADSMGCIIDPTDNSSMNEKNIEIKRVNSVVSADFVEDSVSTKDDKIITITYIANGVKSISKTKSVCYDSNKCTVKLPTITPSNHHTAIGWSTDKNASNAEYEAGAEAEFTKSTTLYAIQAQLYVCYNISCDKTCSSGSTLYQNEEDATSTCEGECGKGNCVIDEESDVYNVNIHYNGSFTVYDNVCDAAAKARGASTLSCTVSITGGCNLTGKVKMTSLTNLKGDLINCNNDSGNSCKSLNLNDIRTLIGAMYSIGDRDCADQEKEGGYVVKLTRTTPNKVRMEYVKKITSVTRLKLTENLNSTSKNYTYEGSDSYRLNTPKTSCNANYTSSIDCSNIVTANPKVDCADYYGHMLEEEKSFCD